MEGIRGLVLPDTTVLGQKTVSAKKIRNHPKYLSRTSSSTPSEQVVHNMSNDAQISHLGNTTMPLNPRPCNFTSLPRELRDQIHEYHFLNLDNEWGGYKWQACLLNLKYYSFNSDRKHAQALLHTKASTAAIAAEVRVFGFQRLNFVDVVPSDEIQDYLTDPT